MLSLLLTSTTLRANILIPPIHPFKTRYTVFFSCLFASLTLNLVHGVIDLPLPVR